MDDVLEQLGQGGSEEEATRLIPPVRRQGSGRSEARRLWDRDNPVTSYRLDETAPQEIRRIQAWYKDRGYRVSLDQIASDLLLHAVEAWDRGEVPIDVQEIQPASQAVARE